MGFRDPTRHNDGIEKIMKIRDARGSMWKSDKCNTLRRSLLGFFRGGNGLGFGLENQLVRFKGGVGANEHEVDGRFWHNI